MIIMINNNILKNIKPKKILGKGSEGIVILSNNKKYSVKIYFNNIRKLKKYIKIINLLYNDKNLPKTIYKSYLITISKNSIHRYMENNVPNHFSYIDKNNLEILSKKYKMENKLFEVIKTYNITLKECIKNNKYNYNIVNSLYKQGLLTLLWLYINKGIIHNDIIVDNFFVLETLSKTFKIKIYEDTYKIPLYGYYLIISDFGYAKMIEEEEIYYNPLDDIKRFIHIFMNKINIIHNINNNIIESYVDKRKLYNYIKINYIGEE